MVFRVSRTFLVMAVLLAACAQSARVPRSAQDNFPEVELVRTPVFQGQQEPGGYGAYAYLLSEHTADAQKWKAALDAYLCSPRAVSGPAPTARYGAYIVPIASPARGYRRLEAGDADRLYRDYDYDRATTVIVDMVAAGFIPKPNRRPDSIFFAVFDRPYKNAPIDFGIYDIGGLEAASDIKDWLVAARLALASGQQPATRTTRRETPNFKDEVEAFGTMVMNWVISPSRADILACH